MVFGQIMVEFHEKFVRVKRTGDGSLPAGGTNIRGRNRGKIRGRICRVQQFLRYRVEQGRTNHGCRPARVLARQCSGKAGQVARPLGWSGYRSAAHEKTAELSKALIRSKEERFILFDRPAKGSTILVSSKLRLGQDRTPIISVQHIIS